jgi:hypothetical protein
MKPEPKKDPKGKLGAENNKGSTNSQEEQQKRFKETDFLDDYQQYPIEENKEMIYDMLELDITLSVCRATDCWSEMLFEDRLMVWKKNTEEKS